MIIGINLTFLYEITGIGTYIKNILKRIKDINEEDLKFIIFTAEDTPEEIKFKDTRFYYINLKHKARNKSLRILKEQLYLPILLKKHKINVLWSPAIFHPIFAPCPQVITLHDVIFGLKEHRTFNYFYFYLLLKSIEKNKNIKLITVSNFSKNEIINYFKKDLEIKVIYEGIPELQKINEYNQKKILEKFKIKKPYLFYVGLIVPHKNIENLLRAFKIFSEKYSDFNLVLSGRIVREFINPEKIIEELNLEDKVILTGRISDEEKVALINNSSAFVFISTHEGFGLPVLEAQSLGLPVLASNVTALPEIGGDGCLYVDPYNIDDITRGMEEIVFNDVLRQNLINKGFENIKRFSWKKAAKETLEVIRTAFYENSPSK